MKFWNKSWNIPAFLIFNIVLFSLLFYFDLNRNVNIGAFESIGTVSFKYNTIQRKFNTAPVWYTIFSNTPLRNRDTIKTFPESDAILTLTDGTEIQVDENSMIYLDLIGKTPNITFEGGSIQVNNARSTSPNQALVLKMQDKTVTLNGSDAKINGKNGQTFTISMEQGSATITEKDGKIHKIEKNEIGTIDKNEFSAQKTPYILEEPANHKKLISMSDTMNVNFSWKPNSNVSETTFEMSRSIDFKKIVRSIPSADSANMNLSPGIYYWRVSGKNAEDKRVSSEARKILLIKESGLQLYAPASGSIANFNSENGDVIFSWTPSQTINQYFVEIATDSSFTSNYKLIPVSTNSIRLSNLGDGTYFWRVMTKPSSTGIPSVKSKVSSFIVSSKSNNENFELIQPADNSSLSLIPNQSKNLVSFQWASNAKKFRIQISKNSSFSNTIINELVSSKTFSTNLNSEGNYFWRVSEIHGNLDGAYSKTRKFSIVSSTQKTPEEIKSELSLENSKPPEEITKQIETKKPDIKKPDVKETVKKNTVENVAPNHISPLSGKFNVAKDKLIKFRWDKVKNANYYIVRIFESGKKVKLAAKEKTFQNSLNFRNISKLNVGNFIWDVTPFDKNNKSGKTAKGKFTIEFFDDRLKNLKPEEIEILSPDTIYRDK